MTQTLHIPVADGFRLAATLFLPDNATDEVILIAGGTGIKRTFYERYARFLAGEGFAVVTFDYRGIGDSRPASLKGFEARMSDWGRLDLHGILQWIDDALAPARRFFIGHSAGAQLLGLAPAGTALDAAVFVAGQSGYWRLWPARSRYALVGLWYGLMPILTYAFGYFPARAAGLGEDLPRDVALQWAAWCRTPDYLFGHEADLSGYHLFTAPLLAYSIEDDRYAPAAAVEALLHRYPRATITRKHLIPATRSDEAIGHFGFFRDPLRDVWAETTTWLRAQ